MNCSSPALTARSSADGSSTVHGGSLPLVFEGVIGKGFFAEVHRARCPNLNPQLVAVKKVRKQLVAEYKLQRQLRREVKILKQAAGHANVVRFVRAWADHEFQYIVTEYCDSGSLYDLIGKHGYYNRKEGRQKPIL